MSPLWVHWPVLQSCPTDRFIGKRPVAQRKENRKENQDLAEKEGYQGCPEGLKKSHIIKNSTVSNNCDARFAESTVLIIIPFMFSWLGFFILIRIKNLFTSEIKTDHSQSN